MPTAESWQTAEVFRTNALSLNKCKMRIQAENSENLKNKKL